MENNTIRLEGTVEVVKCYKEATGYIVLDLATESDLITVIGELGAIQEGEELLVEGTYSNHSKYGMQFRAVYCEKKLPTNLEDIEKYLASGVIKGLRSAIAERIVSMFGKDSFYIIENEPKTLAKVKGISLKKAMEMSNDFKNIFKMRAITDYLSKFGLQSSVAMKAFKMWGVETLDNIKENPYILCCDEVSVPFANVEPIAIVEDIPADSFERAVACFTDILNKATLDGHTCVPLYEFLSRASKTLSIPKSLLDEHFKKAIAHKDVYLYCDKTNMSYVYLRQYYIAERYIATKIHTMSQLYTSDEKKSFDKDIDELEETIGVQYGELQRKAINEALNSNFMILTGNPGTGKTTTLNAIITMFKNRGLNVSITAPTGRASKRISEVTGYDAVTIHRLLEVTFDKFENTCFNRNETNPLKCNVLIMDETSMVDTLLFEKVLRAVSVHCQVVIVGDSNQLPSVGAGNILKDLIDCNLLNVVTLTEIFRQAQESAIIMNAHRIIRGEYPDILVKDSDFFFLQRLKVDEAISTILDLWKSRLPKAYGYSSIDNIQVLTPSRKGALGTVSLNKLMQEVINPQVAGRTELKNENYTFRQGDKVMQIRNNYDIEWKKDGVEGKGIYNGDIGIITFISRQSIEIDFDGRVVTYNSDILDQLELAYAITIHKSQGSEFDVVIMPMLQNFKMLSYRNLLYTGVTRAKKLLVMVGSVKELENMVNNDRKVLRNSCLKDMIEFEYKEH